MKQAVAAAILAFLAVAAGKVAVTRPCENVNQDSCTINELRITPCTTSPCGLKRGRNASMVFDYTPNFATEKLTTAVYWADDPTETPFSTVGVVDGCPFTECPTVAGTQKTFTFSLYIGRMLPKGKFWFRWKVWNSEDKSQLCCFETQVALK